MARLQNSLSVNRICSHPLLCGSQFSIVLECLTSCPRTGKILKGFQDIPWEAASVFGYLLLKAIMYVAKRNIFSNSFVDSKTRQLFKARGEITQRILEFLRHGLVLHNDGKWQLSLKNSSRDRYHLCRSK